MSAAAAKKSQSRRLVPVKELIAKHIDALHDDEQDNKALAKAMGYSSPNVISMLKSGAMRIPVNKIVVTAQVLRIDPLFLAMCVDAESDLGLTPLLESISRRTSLTLNEEKLIQRLRKVSGGLDVDMDEYPDAVDKIVEIYQGIADQEDKQHKGTITRLKSKKRSALSAEDRKSEKTND